MTTLLVDGHNIALRSLFAMSKAKPLSTADGVPTGALHTTIITLASYVRTIRPDRIMVCWDGGASWRREVYPEYKQNRVHNGGDPTEFIQRIQEFLILAGVQQVARTREEADDLIAGYWTEAGNDFVHIISGDKDFYQLLNPRTQIHHPGDKEVWTVDRFTEVFGIHPQHMRLVMALTGDKIDGVPGIPHVGIKTAIKIVNSVHGNAHQLMELESFGKIKIPPGVVRRNLRLVDLTRVSLLALPVLGFFTPTRPGGQGWDELVAFLDRWELSVVKSRVLAGRLWVDTGWSPKPARPSDREKGDRLWAY
jgi:DNA polymerase-1